MKVGREERNPVAREVGGGEVGDNLVVREVGGGSWGESSFPGGEGGGKPYIPYTFSH